MGNLNVGNLVAGLSMDTSGFTKGLASASTAMDGFKAGLAKVKTALLSLLTNPVVLIGALIASIIALGKACWDAWEQMDEAYDKIQVATGATGDALDDLKTSFDNVFTNATYVTDANELAGAIGDLNTYLGVTGETLEKLATQFSNLSGMDSSASVSDFSQVINKWGVAVDDASKYLDYFFTLSQANGISMDALSQSLVSNQATMTAFGFTLDESANLIAKMNKAGFDASTLNTSFRMLMSSGVTTRDAFDELVKSIENATTSEEAFTLASKFGSRNVAEIVSLIKTGALSDLSSEMEASANSIEKFAYETESFPDMMARYGRGATLAMSAVGEWMNGTLVWWGHLGERIREKLSPIVESVKNVFSKVAGIFAKYWGDSSDTTDSVIDTIVNRIGEMADFISSAIDWYAENILPKIEPIISAIVTVIKVACALITGDWETAWTGMSDIAKMGLSVLYDIMETGFNFIVGSIESLLQWIVDGIFSALNTALDVVENFINTVIDGVNWLISQWNSVASALGLPTLSYLEHVTLELETPQVDLPEWEDLGIAQSMKSYIEGEDSAGVTVVQNIEINGDVTNPSATSRALKNEAVSLATGVLTT